MTDSKLSPSVKAQRAYRQTLKGKITEEKYEKSDKGRERKKRWAEEQRLKKKLARRQEFIDLYGDIDTILNLLDEKQRIVIDRIYGLSDSIPVKESDIAREWGNTRAWINKIKLQAIAKLEAAKQAKAEATEQDKNSSPEAQREET